jgi:putative membrane protein
MTGPEEDVLDHERERTAQSVQRTADSLERTQLSWVRTCVTLIGAGFGLDRGLAALYRAQLLDGTIWLEGARASAIALASVGTVTLVLATWRHLQRARSLRREHPGIIHVLPILLTSALVIVLGMALTVVLLLLD